MNIKQLKDRFWINNITFTLDKEEYEEVLEIGAEKERARIIKLLSDTN